MSCSTSEEAAVQTGHLLRTIIVEPFELSMSGPTAQAKPRQPQPEHEPLSL